MDPQQDGTQNQTTIQRDAHAPTFGTFGAPFAPDEVGVLGEYRILKKLGKGGMGAVYLATDTRLNRKVALKVMLPDCAAAPDAKDLFLREARAAAGMKHDNVVTVYEAGEQNGVPYIAMEFLEGSPLDKFLKKEPRNLEECVRIGIEAALGLAAAHKAGLIHRDIKPANLWLETPNERVKVLDFGLAKSSNSNNDLTKGSAVKGTPAYMSPEQARGEVVDHRSDLFSLGVVLYELLTSKKPFVGENANAVLIALAIEEPVPVREHNLAVPAAIADLVHQMLAKHPAARPQTATEVAERLSAIQPQLALGSVSQPYVIPSLPLSEQQPTEVPLDTSRPRRRLIAALVVCAALVVALLIALRNPKPDEVTNREPEVPAPKPKEPVPKGDKLPANPKAGDECDIEIAPNTKMRFCYVPAGECQLGSPPAEKGNKAESEEVRERFLTPGFWLGKYEVTQAEWAAVMRGTEWEKPSRFRANGPEAAALVGIKDTSQFPVEYVSWHNCKDFCKRITEHQRKVGSTVVFDLPHENEWEYACRGGRGNSRPFYFGNELNGTQANCDGRHPFGANDKGPSLQRTTPVGTYKALAEHPWGLCDMHGNVYEWCRNTIREGDPRCVLRGGAYNTFADRCRSAFRIEDTPGIRLSCNGLRVLATIRTP